MRLADMRGVPVSMSVQKVPISQMPAALRFVADELEDQLRAGGLEPQPLEGGQPVAYTCPCCESQITGHMPGP